MQQHEGLTDITKEPAKINKSALEKDNLQYNCQDLDQEQHTEFNPAQTNTQDVHIYIMNETSDHSAKITGITIYDHNKETAVNIPLDLFIGHDAMYPIYKTKSDEFGNFTIPDLPPGFYTLQAGQPNGFRYRSPLIKVLNCQNVSHTVLLK